MGVNGRDHGRVHQARRHDRQTLFPRDLFDPRTLVPHSLDRILLRDSRCASHAGTSIYPFPIDTSSSSNGHRVSARVPARASVAEDR